MRKFVAQQVLHRHNNQPIAGQVALLVDKIHRNTAACQGVVVAGQLFPVAKATVARPGRALERPFVLPVMHDGHLFHAAGVRHKGQLFQCFPHFGGLAERPCILTPIMADHRTVQLFLSTTAGAPLEVAHTVRAMCHRLQRRKLGNAGALLLADRLPVGKAGA